MKILGSTATMTKKVKHSYSENYSYGRYGAYTDSGEAVSEPIDAINIADGNKN